MGSMVELGADLGLMIDGFAPAELIGAQAEAAEAGGVRTLWIATHLFLRDPSALAAIALSRTDRLHVALMAVSPYAMHPVHAAMAAATLDEMFPGRVTLSLGVGAPGDRQAAGIDAPRPLATMREATGVCRALFSGEAVEYEGEIFQLSGRRLASGARDIPIVLAASGPKMLALSGEAADGVLISAATSAPFVRWSLDQATAGGGAPRGVGIVYCRIADTTEEAVAPLRRDLGFILRGAHHERNVALGGATLDQEALRQAYAAEDWQAVERLVTADVLSAHTAAGTAEHARMRIAEYAAAGLDEVVIGGFSAPDEILATARALTGK